MFQEGINVADKIISIIFRNFNSICKGTARVLQNFVHEIIGNLFILDPGISAETFSEVIAARNTS